jgi:hypothetical protein
MSVWRSRWAAVGAAVAATLGSGGIGLVRATATSGERPVTITVEPTRILDTRVDLGLPGRFVNETPRDLQVTGDVPIAPSGTATVVPAGAIAAIVNVTVVFPNSPGFLSLRPGGAAGVPSTSNVNWLASGAIEPNAATVDLAGDGTMQVYVKTASPTGTAHVLVDVVGYTVDHTHDDAYYTEDEVDALIAGVGGSDYQNVIVVAKSGGHFTTVTAAMDSISDASSSNGYLVWVAPGVYENEDVDMRPYVDIQGSGQGVTVLKSTRDGAGFGPDAATLVGADNAELRHITVEASGLGGNWSHAIYTAAGTSFKNVTAISMDGQRSRGIFVDTGGRAIMIDVVMVASGASSSNIGLDVYQGVVFADGLFTDVTGGTAAKGILVTEAASEVQIENVTTHASGGVSDTTGLETINSSATIEGLRSIVVSESATDGLECSGAGNTVRVLGATIYAESNGSNATGVYGSNCDLELRDAVVDAVASGGNAFGVSHYQSDSGQSANVTIADVELRAESGSASAYGLLFNSGGGSPAGTFGRVTELNARATGGSQSLNTYVIRHDSVGEVQYRALSLIAGGDAFFMYGIQTNGDGTPRFDDVVIDAVGEAEATVFGVEFQTDSTTLTNTRVKAVNFDSDTDHDAVGVKANGASGVTFTDVTAYAEAETNVWGADLVNSDTRLVRVDARSVSSVNGVSRGAQCSNSSIEIHDSLLRGSPGPSSSYGLYALTGCTAEVRGSSLSGATSSVRSLGDADVIVVDSSLDGGAGSSGSGSDSQECTAVTYNSSGSEAFQATTSDPCP